MSLYDDIIAKAKGLGFEKVYFTQPKTIETGNSRLVSNPLDLYGWTTCVLLLAYPYKPFCEGEVVSGYYLASNESYHKLRDFITWLNDIGIQAKRVSLPVKKAVVSANIGTVGRNTLLRLKEYGSRIVLYAVAIDTCAPLSYNEPAQPCGECRACIDACPGKAIGETPYDYIKSKCLRYYMEDDEYPTWVKENVNMYLGCERCMFACPYNEAVGTLQPSDEVRQAFDFDRILSGDIEKAIQYVGSNVDKKRLMRDAAILKENKK